MKYLFSCLKRYRLEAILSPLFKLLEACMELVVPLIVAEIINRGVNGVNGADKSVIIWGCVILVAFGLLGFAFAITAQYFAAKAAVGVSSELRERLFQKLQSFSFTQIDKIGTPTMITRMTSDVGQVQTGVNLTLRLLMRSPFIVLGALGMAFVVDVKAALVFVAVIPALSVVVAAVMAACIPLYRKVQSRLDRVYSSTRENLAGVRVIRAFRKEGDEQKEFFDRTESLKKTQKRVGRIAAITAPLTYAIVNAAVVALVYVGAIRVNSGSLDQGDVLALYSYLSLILVELIKFANFIVNVTRAVSCQKRIASVLEMEGEPDILSSDEGEESDIAVSFENVTYAYEGGGAPALSDISFSVKKGETVGILGGTGSGKSTLVNLIPRFYAVSEGKVKVNGKDVNALSAEKLRERVGIVPQRAVLFKGTIRSNLLWGDADADEETLLAAVKCAQAEDVVEAKGGLNGEVAQGGKNFSGGQRQRLTIARALVKNPEILILDDSASALDYATDARLRAALRERGGTTFIVSQRAASLMHADKIVVLDDGKIAGLGTHAELLAGCPLYREIYDTQFKEARA